MAPKWSTTSHLLVNMVHPNPCKEITKAAALISGGDAPLLTFIYPSFDCGSDVPASPQRFGAGVPNHNSKE